MFDKIKNLVATTRNTKMKSSEIAAALEEARAEMASAEARSAEHADAYATGLLVLDDAKLKALIESRQAAAIQRDRAQALVAALEAKLVATREAEIVAALTAERDAAEAEAEAVAQLIRREYPKLAGSLVAMLERLTAADDVLVAVNQKLVDAKRHSEVMRDVQSRVLPSQGNRCPQFNIWGYTVLKEFEGFAPGWNSPWELGGQHSIVNPTGQMVGGGVNFMITPHAVGGFVTTLADANA